MKRRDGAVLAISVVLLLVVGAALLYSFKLDRRHTEPQATTSGSSLLSLTWGPSLCKAEAANSGCKSGHVGTLGSTLVLHGLWPQPSTEQYCDVSKRDASRRSVALPDDVRKKLQDMMSDATVMAPHEWYAHGTCSGVDAGDYFAIAANLTAQARIVLDPVFNQANGKQLSTRVVREAFDTEFGRGAGQRIGLTCRDVAGQTIVYEVRLSLPSVIDLRAGKNLSLADALAKGPAIAPGCGKGTVVR